MSQNALNVLSKEAYLKLPLSVNPANFKFMASKWAEIRHNTVESIRNKFREEPGSVFILKDSKLAKEELAVVRKEHLENLIKLNSDLSSGEAAIQQSMEGIVRSVDLLIAALTKSNEIQIPEDSMVEKALQVVTFEIKGAIKSSVIFKNEPADKPATKLSKEEEELFKQYMESENSSDED